MAVSVDETHTKARQRALGTLLRFRFAGDLGDSARMPLGERMVSGRELGEALSRLSSARADLLLYVNLRFGRDWTYAKVAARLRTSQPTAIRKVTEGLDLLLGFLGEG